MTEPSGQWLKLWLFFDNPKIMMLSAEDFQRWVFAIASAKKWDQNGLLPPMEYMALWSHKPIDWCRDAIERLVERKLIDRLRGGDKEGRFGIHDWEKWQGSSDTSNAERQKRYRDRKRDGRNVTPITRNALETEGDRETETETDTEEESARNARPRQAGFFDQNQSEEQEGENPLGNPWFEVTWRLYSEDFGDPRSPLDAAWEAFRKFSDEQQKEVALAVGLWRLVEGPARKANPEQRIKFLDTFIGKGHWKQFTIKTYPQFADAALRFIDKALAPPMVGA
jgi:hypothetical protein